MTKDWLRRLVEGALRDTIMIHGPILMDNISSASKRVAGRIYGELNSKHTEDTYGNI